MSKITNPSTESSVTCGFYNSLGDRKYDSAQMSKIFDGLITDGIFATIGTAFVVKAGTGNTVNVGVGRAWFNHTWTLNDAILPVVCDDSDVLLNRIDAIVLEVNGSDDVRDNFIKFVKGTPANSPAKPVLINTEFVHQYPLCYIERVADSKEITQSNITNCVGTTEAPFVTGILQTISLDELLGQWQDELDRFVANEEADLDAYTVKKSEELDEFKDTKIAEFNEFQSNKETEFNTWYAEMTQLMGDVVNETNTWSENQKATILDWFDNMKGQLSVDAAANLQMQIDNSEVEKILRDGFSNGVKTISEDGTVITTVDTTGRTLVKTFTNNFLTSTTILTNSHGVEAGRLVKNFSSDGNVITSEITIA